jgi:hypothetical protein
VVTFYANLKDIEFAGRMAGGGAVENDDADGASPRVPSTSLSELADLIDGAYESAQPLLSQLAHTPRWWRRWWRWLVG